MKFALIISSALLAVASGQVIVSITSPLSGTKLKAGSDAVISWVNPSVPTISQIVLAKGPSNALQPVSTIANNIDTAAGKYVWKIPYEVENGEYAFELGTSPDLAFAGPFTIEGGVGGTLPSSNSTSSNSSAAVPSSSPSSNPVAPAAPAASSAPASSAPGNAPSDHVAPPAATASNAKAPAAGSSPTSTSSAIQISLVEGKYLAAVAGAVIFSSQLL
ncbi:hypothetical protein BCR42DRAFT_127144 [Absidia repens]|uniref:Yeast cell wall synthesis Kre9/Knh1-like N-terminal domain-containing protein n=1 Tax=Absidia repens TaxID=90262 RepID=A0A1X2IV93_9FUNG|nr:hypothetical protein BCR42DRAFT_127144 [Absidia repens]